MSGENFLGFVTLSSVELVNKSSGHNKFYNIYLLRSTADFTYTVRVEYGGIGKAPLQQDKVKRINYYSVASRTYTRLIDEKRGKGYVDKTTVLDSRGVNKMLTTAYGRADSYTVIQAVKDLAEYTHNNTMYSRLGIENLFTEAVRSVGIDKRR